MLLNKLLSMRSVPAGRVKHTMFAPTRSTAGINMTEETALNYGPVFSACKVISETVAMLPWRVFKIDGQRRELLGGSKLDNILHRQPNDEMTAFRLREYLITSALLWGNGYAEIERNMLGEVVALWPLHPSQIEIQRNEVTRELVYKFTPDAGGHPVYLRKQDVFHLAGPTSDGVCGRSMISIARESWGFGVAAEQFGAAYFGNGGIPAVVIQETEGVTTEMDKEAAANLVASFDAKHRGANKAGRTAYLEKGFEIKKIGVPHKEAQFIESRKFQVTEIARWFRLPPHKIGDMEKATFSNIEQQSIDFVVDSIMPWAQRLEQEADMKLHRDEDIITKINLLGLLRGDSQARGEYYTKLWGIGVFSPNDILGLEDMDPVDGGDQRFVPLNMIPLTEASSADRSSASSSIRGVLVDAHQRMMNKELKALDRAAGAGKDLDDWGTTFYNRHRLQLAETLLPGANAAAEYLGADTKRLDDLIALHCERYIETSLRAVMAGKWDNWENRPGQAADDLLQRLAGASKNEQS
ncbi:MAG: phage portal protein [Gammaproteobacteria bacterium]